MTLILLFGKMPSHGDFVSRGLSAEQLAVLDGWLSAELATARDELGEVFEARFDTAPPWRFAWPEEDTPDATRWAAGAIAPSVDSVGRRFPILVARRGLDPSATEHAARRCEQAIYDAFDQGWSADRLASEVEYLEPGAADGGLAVESWWLTLGDEEEPMRVRGRYPSHLMLAMLTATEAGA